ncbi:MAG TPA: zf-HC2 domain-containing protein [Chitinophagales bacterium]|nr:zf-HC2 domain-containing protein [Chitinophagales bacterium]
MAKKQHIRKITCEEAEKSFNDLIDGFLKGKTKEELEHHIEHCAKCFGRVEFEKKLKERIRSTQFKGSPASLRRKIAALFEET